MSAAVPSKVTLGHHPVRLAARQLLRWTWTFVVAPVYLVRGVRAALTGSSTTLLMMLIVSLNIIWGYPWTGLFAACASLMVVGWGVNRLMRPRLAVDVKVPGLAVAGQPFPVRQHVENISRLASLDVKIGFAAASRRRAAWSASEPESVTVIRPGCRIDLTANLCFAERGIHRLPDITAESGFPFYLFRATTRLPSHLQIAVAPRLLSRTEDLEARSLLSTVEGWSRRQLAGESLDYVGSREYQTGMPVRRWDFSSWARLGRPIVREFTTPSVRTAVIAVDTAADGSGQVRKRRGGESRLERMLSLAATAVTELGRHNVEIRMLVTGEPAETAPRSRRNLATGGDVEALLTRLAAATRTTPEAADSQIHAFLAQPAESEVLLLTARRELDESEYGCRHVTVVRVDSAHQSPPAATPGAVADDGKPALAAAAADRVTRG